MSELPANTPNQIRLPLLLAAALAIGMFIGQQLPHYGRHLQIRPNSTGATSEIGQSLDEILGYISARYVDTLDMDALKGQTIAHLLEQLDPHSNYSSPEEAKAIADEMNGGFEGIGVEFVMLEDTIQVITPLTGGPAEIAGIMAGDKLVTINDTLVAGIKIDNQKIFNKLRGKKGTTVRLGIRRNFEATLRQFTLTRDVIPTKSVDISYMLDQRTGYIKVSRFTSKTYNEFMEALRDLAEKSNMSDLVLDLRGNPGGYLEECTQMLSQFFPDGKMLVYTQGRMDSRREYKSNGHARFNIRQVAVLIDEGSASASEIVAGAIQDNDRGWVIGRRSYGKGLVQEEYPLTDGGKLRLTIARYYTPSGRSIQRPYKNNKNYENEEALRLASGELSDASKIKLADTTQFYTGMGRIVYGGGGITPDVFIPLDTTFMSKTFEGLNQQLVQFVTRWYERQDRSKLPGTIEEFIKNYTLGDDSVSELVAYSATQGVKTDPKELINCRNELKLRMKARIAHLLFKDNSQFKVLNSDDPAIAKALQLLQNNEPLKK